MDYPEVKRLAAEAAAACRAVMGSPLDVAITSNLRSVIGPLAERSFEPLDGVPPYKRGLINQSAFLAEVLRDRLDDGASGADHPKKARSVAHGAASLLAILEDFMKETE